MAPLNVVVYTPDVWDSVCPVLRVTGPLEQAGARVVCGGSLAPTGELATFSTTPIATADVVVVQRDFPRYESAYDQVLAAVQHHRRPLLYETDDLLWNLPLTHPQWGNFAAPRLAILRAVLQAATVVVSTPALADALQTLHPNIHCLSNLWNEQLWPLRPPPAPTPARPLIIGYMGSITHAPDMALIEPALLTIAQKYGARVAFQFWGLPPPPALAAVASVQWDAVNVRGYAAFAQFWLAQTCDIVLAPLADNFFNRCKSAIKFLEYSALGVPGVYSRVTPYQAIVRDGENGLLAEGPAEWVAALTTLIENPALRQRLAHNAQTTLQKEWCLADQAARWAQVYGQVVQPPHYVFAGEPEGPLRVRLGAAEEELRILKASPGYRLQQAWQRTQRWLVPPLTGRARLWEALVQAQATQRAQGWPAGAHLVQTELGLQLQAVWQRLRGQTKS